MVSSFVIIQLSAENRWLDHVQDVIAELDVRIMLRVPHDILKQRRHERHGYHTAGEMDLAKLRQV